MRRSPRQNRDRVGRGAALVGPERKPAGTGKRKNIARFRQPFSETRLADEYDAAQERGEVASDGGDRSSIPNGKTAPVGDLGLRHDEIHEARRLRNAAVAGPFMLRLTHRLCLYYLSIYVIILRERTVRFHGENGEPYDRGVDLFVEGGELHYKSRIEGTVTNDDLVDLSNHKAEIIALLPRAARDS